MALFSLFRKGRQQASSGSISDALPDDEEPKAARKRKKAQGPVDPVLPEKKRARRRLVGVIALVLAAVVGLPMVLESEPQPLASDIDIQIPSKDKVTADKATMTEKNAGPAVEVLRATGADVPPPAAAIETANEASKPSGTREVNQEQEAADKAPAKPEQKSLPKAASSPEMRDKVTPARAQSEDKAATASTGEKFVLQVAALSSADSQEKAKELQARLSKAGIRSYTEKFATPDGKGIRVRIGPFASREEAEKTRAKLAPIGLNGFVMPG